jgi:hypothetical protein
MEVPQMKITRFSQGRPSWAELATPDPDGAVRFYGALLGWTDEANPIGPGAAYHMQRLGGEYAAAIRGQRPDEAARGEPPHWTTYITVTDIDAVVARVPALGGAVFAPPFDVMDRGRMATIADPTGGVVCLWQANRHIGAGVVNEPGALAWAELSTRDPARAAAFFQELLGVQVAQSPGTGAAPYTMLLVDGEPAAGILAIDMPGMPVVWGAYFQVVDVPAAIERVKDLGGAPVTGIMDVPGLTFGIAQDPQGAVFGLMARATT